MAATACPCPSCCSKYGRQSLADAVGLLALATAVAVSLSLTTPSRAADPWIEIKGGAGPGQGKHVVLVSGDEEYRSEEALPQLAKILAKRHGFDCTVLFAVDDDGVIN